MTAGDATLALAERVHHARRQLNDGLALDAPALARAARAELADCAAESRLIFGPDA